MPFNVNCIRRTSIGVRLYAVLFIIVAILGLAISLAIIGSINNSNDMKRGYEAAQDFSTVVARLRIAMLETAVATRNIGLETELPDIQKSETEALAARKRYKTAWEEYRQLQADFDARNINLQLEKLDSQFDGLFRDAVTQASQMFTDGAVAIIRNDIDPLQRKADHLLQEIDKMQWAASVDRAASIDKRQGEQSMAIMAAAAAAAVLAFAIGLMTTRSITLPLEATLSAVELIGDGKLSEQVWDAGQDEVGGVLRTLEKSRANIASAVISIRGSADELYIGAAEISQGNLYLSERTETQASALQRTSSSMSNLGEKLSATAKESVSAGQMAQEVVRVTRKASRDVEDVVSTMNLIQASAKQISDITTLIDGIAFQTNILALNAAVESARAGEHGRGFLVVASEVRALSNRASAAAKDIKLLVNNSVERVTAGTVHVGSAVGSMQRVVDSVTQMQKKLDSITESSASQITEIDSVSREMSEIDSATQQNAALVEQMAASAMNLRGQADKLVLAVRRFEVAES